MVYRRYGIWRLVSSLWLDAITKMAWHYPYRLRYHPVSCRGMIPGLVNVEMPCNDLFITYFEKKRYNEFSFVPLTMLKLFNSSRSFFISAMDDLAVICGFPFCVMVYHVVDDWISVIFIDFILSNALVRVRSRGLPELI